MISLWEQWAIVWLLAFVAVADGRKLLREPKLENFYQCPDHKNTTLLMKDTFVKRISSTKRKLFGRMVLQDDIEEIKGKVELYKCSSKAEPDTCEYYTGIKYGSVCRDLRNAREPTYTYFNQTDMPIKCPMPKGNWEIKGLDFGMPPVFPLSAGFWRVKSKGYDLNNKVAICFVVEVTIYPRI